MPSQYGRYASAFRAETGPGAFNDPDFLVVGCPTDRPCEPFSGAGGGPPHSGPPLSAIEQRAQFSMWCVWGAPLIIGSDVRHLDPWALGTLSNKAAIAINQAQHSIAYHALEHSYA